MSARGMLGVVALMTAAVAMIALAVVGSSELVRAAGVVGLLNVLLIMDRAWR